MSKRNRGQYRGRGKDVTIHVAIITHRHGTTIYAGKTEEAARRQVAEYCAQWWEEIDTGNPPPRDQDDLIYQYFETQGDRMNGEYLDLETVAVK